MTTSNEAVRAIFFVSDGTGITAETMGHSVLTQFDSVKFDTLRIPFVDTAEKALAAAKRIALEAERTGTRPIVVNTVMNPELTEILAGCGGLMLDVFEPFIAPLELELGAARSPRVGRAHALVNFAEYESRINATNYAMSHDDGIDVDYSDADVILVGVSRSGKTPTCLYMALHFGIKAANYPLTEEDLDRQDMPPRLVPYRERLFGLTIDPMRLQHVRSVRRPNSKYATIDQCRWEVAQAEKLLKRERIQMLSTTHTSIEEIGSKVLQALGIDRHLY